MDWGSWADRLPEKECLQAGGQRIHLIHDLGRLRLDAVNNACIAVVTGILTVRRGNQQGVLFVNPGSAGAPRYGERACVALLRVSGPRASADLICLQS